MRRRLAGVPALVGGTLVDMVRSTWQTAVWVLHPRASTPGLVDVPIPRCRSASAAGWGIRVGLSPDTVVVDIDEEAGRMLLRVIDARNPGAVVAAQLDSYRRIVAGLSVTAVVVVPALVWVTLLLVPAA